MLECFENFIKNISNFDSIVDIGCGSGKTLLKLKELGFEFIEGCDKSLEMVNHCKEKNLNVVKADIINLPYENNKFDITLSISVIHHLQTSELRENAIKELLRITKNNGLIFISVNAYHEYGKNDQMIKQGDNDVFYHLFDTYELTNLCSKIIGCSNINESYEQCHRIGIMCVKK